MQPRMIGSMSPAGFQTRLVSALYTDAMLLADEARSYFDDRSRRDRDTLPPVARVAFSCESLKVTTRLMHVIAWLLTRRAVDAGELSPRAALDPSRRLGEAPLVDRTVVNKLPARARALVAASVALHRRAAALDRAYVTEEPAQSPALAMQQRLAASL